MSYLGFALPFVKTKFSPDANVIVNGSALFVAATSVFPSEILSVRISVTSPPVSPLPGSSVWPPPVSPPPAQSER